MQKDKPVRKSLILRGKKGRDAILYDKETKAIHVLNPSAAFIWELCDGEHSLKDIEDIMRREHSINEEHEVFLDIQNIINSFIDKGLLE